MTKDSSAAPFETVFSADAYTKVKSKAPGNQMQYSVFNSMPMPTSKDEDWRLSDVRIFSKDDFLPLDLDYAPKSEFSGCAVKRDAEMPERKPNDKLEAAINLFSHCLEIRVKPGAKAVARMNFSPARSYVLSRSIILGIGSSLALFDNFSSGAEGRMFFGMNTAVSCGPDSSISHYSSQSFSPKASGLDVREYELSSGAAARNFSILSGGGFFRQKTRHNLVGDGSSVPVQRTAIIGGSESHFDLVADATHSGLHTKADIAVRSALSGKSSCAVRGKITILKGAQGTDSFFSDKSIHLSRGVRSDSIPSLVIDDNDVKASHGSSIGQLDESALFYMQSRGIPKTEAKKLAVEGMLESILFGADADWMQNVMGVASRNISYGADDHAKY